MQHILRFINDVCMSSPLFILMTVRCSMGMPLFVHSSVCGYLGCFQFLAIVNKAVTDI